MHIDELRERFTEDTGESVARWDGVFNPDYVYWLEEYITKNSIKEKVDHTLCYNFSRWPFR